MWARLLDWLTTGQEPDEADRLASGGVEPSSTGTNEGRTHRPLPDTLPEWRADQMLDALVALQGVLGDAKSSRRWPTLALILRLMKQHGAEGLVAAPAWVLQHALQTLAEDAELPRSRGLKLLERRLRMVLACAHQRVPVMSMMPSARGEADPRARRMGR